MLSYMRKNANSTIVWLIIGAIAVVFIFFGVGPGGGGGSAIEVNGQDVSLEDYANTNEMVNQALINRGLNDSPDFQEMVKQVTVDEVVNLYLTRQFCQTMGLTPSDRDVARSIAAIPQFQSEGRFDPARYEDVIRAMRTTKPYFEKQQRDQICKERLHTLIIDLSMIQQPEALEFFHMQDDKVEFDYVFFPSSGYRTGLVPTAEALDAYYVRNQHRWVIPAELEIEYVLLRPSDFKDKVILEEAELKQYYEGNKQAYNRPESAEVSHILFLFEGLEPDSQEREKTLEKANQAYERAKKEDFAALALELSEDKDTAALGGALGSFNRGAGLGELDVVIFSTPVNQVSQPVETPLGYHLLKITGRQEAGTVPFEEIREPLEEERRVVLSRALAVSQLEDLIVRSETSKLADAAASIGLTTSTSLLVEDIPPYFFEGDAGAVASAFEAPLGRVADPVEKKDHLTLFTPLVLRESRIPALDEVRQEVEEAWITDETDRLAREAATTFAGQAAEMGWSEAKGAIPVASDIKSGRTPLVSRTIMSQEELFNQADSRQLLGAIYSVAAVGQVSPVTVNGNLEAVGNGTFALTLVNFEPADPSLLKMPGNEAFISMISAQKADLFYRVWLGQLRREATIKVPREYL